MKTSIVVLMYNQLETTKKCFEYLRKYTDLTDVEIVAVNNGSTDGTTEWLAAQPDITQTIHHITNIGLTKGFNSGIQASEGEEVMLLANDILLTPNWLPNLRACLSHRKDVGIIVPIMNAASNFQSINAPYTTLEEMEVFAAQVNVSNPQAWQERTRLVTCCCFGKKEVFTAIGGFDERYEAGGAFSDDDLTLTAIQQGYRNYLCYDTFVHHYGSQTVGEGLVANIHKGRAAFREKWGFDAWEKGGANTLVLNLSQVIRNTAAPFVEIGAGLGGSAAMIHHYFPNLIYSGFEKEKKVTDLLNGTFNITHSSSYQEIPSGKKYQYVFLNGILEDSDLDKKELESTLKLVTSAGIAFGVFRNQYFLHHLESQAKHLFTEERIRELFTRKGFRQVTVVPNRANLTQAEQVKSQEEAFLWKVPEALVQIPSYFVLAVK